VEPADQDSCKKNDHKMAVVAAAAAVVAAAEK